MRSQVECLVCFMRQALATAKVCTSDPAVHRAVVQAIGGLLPQLDFEMSPPENAVQVYGRIAAITGNRDPYKEIKEKSTAFVRELLPEVRDMIRETGDSLHSAVRFAIAANVIDYGSQYTFDARARLATCLTERLAVDDFDALKRALSASDYCSVLYLADNCGEILFDALLIEQLQLLGCTVQVAVRGDVILNDATLPDAAACGLASQTSVISNGTGCPGTPLASCTRELQDAFAGADVIISKGQGNFETLSEIEGPVFYLLTVKCPVVARRISSMRGLPAEELEGCGEMILMQGGQR